MLSRFAWIACVGLTLFCVAILVPGTADLSADESSSSDDSSANHWPIADQLIEQVTSVQTIPEMKRWSDETITLLTALSQAGPNSDQLSECLAKLEVQARALPQISAVLWRRVDSSLNGLSSGDPLLLFQQHCDVSRLSYRLSRRLVVWNTIRESSTQRRTVTGSFSDTPYSSASFGRITFEHLDPRWVEYLQLEELKSAFDSFNPDAAEQKSIARKVLARVNSPVLTPGQAEYIQQIIDPDIVRFLKQHASESVDRTELLKRIENYETHASALTGYYLNDLYQNLLWSGYPADQAIASEIQTHYRNANFRIAISRQLMNRMIPQLPTTASPVSENIKGARVSGQSQVSNQLRIDFVPSPSQINLQLATQGRVQSDTIARTKTFRIQNLGHAQFEVVKPISISPRGIDTSAKPYSLSSGNQSVIGLQSKLDDIPIMGWMARKLAAKKLREEAPETDRMFRQTVKSSAESQVQEQVEQQIAKLRYDAYTRLYQPLLAMELEPEAVQMSTTEQQIIMRYRLAGRDQMAAHTARPRDNGNSLMSFQLHETAINNAIARIGLNGNKFNIEQLTEHLGTVLGATQFGNAEQSVDQEIDIWFAPLDPIHVAFGDDRLNITLKLKSLKIGENGKAFRNVTMTASYKLAVEGTKVFLQQDDDGTQIKGSRLGLGGKAAISAVMKKLFQQEYSFDALPKQLTDRMGSQLLAVSQLVVSDGWLAVSIDDQNQSANRLGEPIRVGTIRRLINRR